MMKTPKSTLNFLDTFSISNDIFFIVFYSLKLLHIIHSKNKEDTIDRNMSNRSSFSLTHIQRNKQTTIFVNQLFWGISTYYKFFLQTNDRETQK